MMKKLMIAALTMLLFSAGSFAQSTTPTVKPTTVKTKAANKARATAPTVKPATTAVTAPAPVKKDGTADMRFKANKQAAKTTTGPLKKDGTKDMRYKTNKKN